MTSSTPSEMIRDWRLRRGMSLAELARVVGTSPATLCKYEKGWDRFELYTLQKIATALGCRLNISFEPIHHKGTIKKSASAALRQLNRLFWDRKLTAADVKKYPVWLVERVLEYGALDDVHVVMSLMGKKHFLRVVSQCKFSSPKTRRFWERILNREDMSCTKKSYPRRPWPF